MKKLLIPKKVIKIFPCYIKSVKNCFMTVPYGTVVGYKSPRDTPTSAISAKNSISKRISILIKKHLSYP